MNASEKLRLYVDFVNKTGNVDAVFRLVQGICSLMKASSEAADTKDKAAQDHLGNVTSKLGEARHSMRLVGFLKQVSSLLNQRDAGVLSSPLQSSDNVLNLAKTVSMIVFFTYDNLGWAQKFQAIPKDTVKLGKTASQMWFLYVVLDLVHGILKLQRSSAKNSPKANSDLLRDLIINCCELPGATQGAFDWPENFLSPIQEALLTIAAAGLTIRGNWPSSS